MCNNHELLQAIASAQHMYHRLVLLAGPGDKSSILEVLTQELKSEVINVNMALSEQLLELTPRQRALRTPQFFAELITIAGEVAILNNIEILFDKGLQQDPLRLLQGNARNKTLIVAWNAIVENNKLTYAVPGHDEYKQYPLNDLLLLQVN